MDFKKIVDQVKDAAEDLKEKAEAKIKETRDTLDKDHNNIPDALEGLTDKAKTLAGQAGEKAKEVAGMAQEKLDQATAKLGETVDQTKVKLEELKGDAEKVVASARDRMGMSDKNSKQG